MQTENLSAWTHDHVFDTGNALAERSTRVVMWITAAAMVIEITAGWWFNSMALLADGWHMSSHAFAIGVSALAYAAARRYAQDRRFAFGTWKIEILGGFASAIFLLGVAAMMVVGSIERIVSPQAIQYREAIAVAILGLAVNLVCALILGRAHHHGHDHHHHGHGHGHSHGHGHGHSHGHGHEHRGHAHDHPHHDLNLKSAYLHVIADAATSVLAIVALVGGWIYGWSWLDPVMGIVGAVLVAVWAKGLLVETGRVLLDREMDHPVVGEIRDVLEADGVTRVTDLHVWRVGYKQFAGIVSVKSARPKSADEYRADLSVHGELVHLTIEVRAAEALPAAANSPQVS